VAPPSRCSARPELRRVVGVVPAAGQAERLQPLPGSKETLSVGGRPVLDYVVERLRVAPADEIRLVTRPEKRDVAERARSLGVTVVEARPATLSLSILAGMEWLAGNDIVLLGLPDSVWEPLDGFARLLGALTADAEVVLGLFRSREPERGDVATLDSSGRVAAVHVKSAQPPGDLVWGIAAARADALARLREHEEPGHLFDELARGGRALAVRFPGEFIDIGTKEALERARALLGE
jgi:glucose-1-phosphate thymidylyltransferase